MEKKIKIVEVKEIAAKSGNKFKAYKALDKNNKRIDCKFRKEVTNLPTGKCYIYVDDTNFNVSEKGEYPVLWVAKIERIEEINSSDSVNEKYFD